ncbi:MAG TPA: FCD domain-containing protein, partial [Actinomycetota bacterium]
DDVAEVRLVLEREGARLAASRATPEQVQALTEALAARRAATDGPAYVAADIAFHRLLLESSGNQLLAELYRGTGGNEQDLLPLILADGGLAVVAPHLQIIDAAHDAIVEAVSAGDPDTAAAAAERMVRLVQDQIIPGKPSHDDH